MPGKGDGMLEDSFSDQFIVPAHPINRAIAGIAWLKFSL